MRRTDTERRRQSKIGQPVLGRNFANQRFYLFDIICKTIYDTSDPILNQSSTDTERRRRGLQYGELTENELAKFELLMRNYVFQP